MGTQSWLADPGLPLDRVEGAELGHRAGDVLPAQRDDAQGEPGGKTVHPHDWIGARGLHHLARRRLGGVQLAEPGQRDGVEPDFPGKAGRPTDLRGPVQRLLGQVARLHEAPGHDLSFRHPAEDRRQNRSVLHACPVVHPAEGRQALVDPAVVGEQTSDQVVAVGRRAHRGKRGVLVPSSPSSCSRWIPSPA